MPQIRDYRRSRTDGPLSSLELDRFSYQVSREVKDVQGNIRLHLLPFFGEQRKMTTITT